MIYRIATIYGFSSVDPTRRGEVVALWGLSMGSSEAVKMGLSVVELVPVIGAAVGSTSNAMILYGLGNVACRFYEAKRRAIASFPPSEIADLFRGQNTFNRRMQRKRFSTGHSI